MYYEHSNWFTTTHLLGEVHKLSEWVDYSAIMSIQLLLVSQLNLDLSTLPSPVKWHTGPSRGNWYLWHSIGFSAVICTLKWSACLGWKTFSSCASTISSPMQEYKALTLLGFINVCRVQLSIHVGTTNELSDWLSHSHVDIYCDGQWTSSSPKGTP